jgi:deoxyribodipyrimidine photo-lyase
VVLGQTYPERLVDHVAAAAQARTAIYALRKGRDYRDAADAIQHRHGSRKSGLASTEGRKRKAPARKAPPHPEFDFG